MNASPDLEQLPSLPVDEEGPVFAEPWQAQAFAMTLKLYEAGCFTWDEWAMALSAKIDAAKAAGDPDLGDTYYLHWLAALESLVAEKELASPEELTERKVAWQAAADATPHGDPILLSNRPG